MGISSGISTGWPFVHCVQVELEFRNVGFWGEGKTGEKPLVLSPQKGTFSALAVYETLGEFLTTFLPDSVEAIGNFSFSGEICCSSIVNSHRKWPWAERKSGWIWCYKGLQNVGRNYNLSKYIRALRAFGCSKIPIATALGFSLWCTKIHFLFFVYGRGIISIKNTTEKEYWVPNHPHPTLTGHCFTHLQDLSKSKFILHNNMAMSVQDG